jgi:hypothetical protein
VKAGDQKVVDRIVQKSGEPLPDIDTLNNSVPREFWEADFNGNMKGPWAKNYTVGLVDPDSGAKVIV